jgi:hypothetical protein
MKLMKQSDFLGDNRSPAIVASETFLGKDSVRAGFPPIRVSS